MNRNLSCEDFLTAKMARELDGEESEGISAERIRFHMENCANCLPEFERIASADDLLKKQTRIAPENVDLWSAIETRIKPEAKSRVNWQPFLFLGIFLVAAKLLEMLSETDLGFVFKLAPLVFIIALFVLLKENPFKINTELILEE